MKKKLILTALLCLLSMGWALAQSMTVTGTVTSSDDGEPLFGATVRIKGTTRATSTNSMGQYQIAAEMSEVLVFDFTGTTPQEVTISRNIIDVALSFEEFDELDEVMVIAYGTTKKGDFAGSAASVNKERIAQAQVSNVSQLLSGSTPGVQSISPLGQPGTDAQIYIRGVGSLSANSEPLYIVDGAPFDGSLSSINPADIESINVLKDAAATSIYGARAANGLVVIATKKGAKDQRKPKIEASFKYGVSSRAQNHYKHVSTDDYFRLTWEALYNTQYYINGLSDADARQYATNNLISRVIVNPYGPNYPKPVGTDGKLASGATPLWDDNWTDEYESDASRMEARLAISGGSANSSYFISLGYLDEKGISPGSGFERYTGRVNLNNDLYKWLRTSVNISLTHSVQAYPQAQDATTVNPLFQANLTPSFYPVYVRDMSTGALILDENGNKQYDMGNGKNGSVTRPSGATPNFNTLSTSRYDKTDYTRNAATIRTHVEADLLPGLTYRGSINVDYNGRDNHTYRNPYVGYYSTQASPGSSNRNMQLTTGFTGNNIFTYSTKIDKHSIKAMAGQEYYQSNFKYISGTKTGFPSLGLEEPESGTTITSFTGYTYAYKLLGFLFSADYNYNSKYYLSATLRTDGSSRFHKDSRWGTFWSVGGSWRIKEENFIKDLNVISQLMLRASFGSQGNDAIGNYAYVGLYAVDNSLGETAFYTDQLPNHTLKWESIETLNLGLDVGFFKNRLSGTFEFFNRATKDMLFTVPMPLSTGYSGYSDNVGNMKNTGFEVQLSGTPIHTRDWRWNITANLTHYKNKITKMPEEIITSYIYRREGGSVNDWFLVEWAGIDPSDGLPRWWKTDASGNRVKTATYDEANNTNSKILKGSALPDLIGGFGTSISYKNIELSCLFAYSIGGYIYDRDKPYILNASSAGRAMSAELLDRWTPENPNNAKSPRLQTSATNWTSISTRFLHDASYLRMKNLTVSYNLPKKWLSKVYMASCRVFVQGENLFTVFGTEGLDPEQTLNGLSYMRYPNMRTITGGIDITF